MSEHCRGVWGDKKNFFIASRPPKDLHSFTAVVLETLRCAQSDSFMPKTADRHAKVRQSEHCFL